VDKGLTPNVACFPLDACGDATPLALEFGLQTLVDTHPSANN
jgi:hypothetical protein